MVKDLEKLNDKDVIENYYVLDNSNKLNIKIFLLTYWKGYYR